MIGVKHVAFVTFFAFLSHYLLARVNYPMHLYSVPHTIIQMDSLQGGSGQGSAHMAAGQS